jgi:tetratricopeptide (TPR) repeat protein
MALWILLKKPDGTGDTVLLTPAKIGISYGPSQCKFEIDLDPDKDDDLYLSADLGGKQGFMLLWREGYVRQSVSTRFQLAELKSNVHGHSADLLFALAVITQIMKDVVNQPIAATGCLNEKSWVEPVEGVPGKLYAVLEVLPAGGVIFYPKANDSEVDSELRSKAQICGVALCPIERLDEAAVYLGIEIKKVYLDCPYRGLEAFHAEHRSIYFGRETEIQDLKARLKKREDANTPGVLIVAASGTGKSSLVQAGLLPDLLSPSQDKKVFSTVWQPSDTGEFIDEKTLVNSIITNWQKQPEFLTIDSNNIETLEQLSQEITENLSLNMRFVWVVNQMEELFTLDFPQSLLKIFFDFLQKLQQIGVWIIGTLRNDFYDRYQAQPTLLKIFGNTGVYDLPPLDTTALRKIIEEPARLADISFEISEVSKKSLADCLLDDMAGNTEALPLLEFVLQELHKGRVSDVMTFAQYEKLGTLMGSIGQRAENLLLTLDAQIQDTLPRLLWKLAAKSKDDARKTIVAQAIYLNDVAENDPIRFLIDAFIGQRLLVKDNQESADQVRLLKVRVAHEALLTHWSRAKSIIDGFIVDRQLHDQLKVQARDWQAALNKKQARAYLIAAGEPLEKAKGLLQRRGEELLPLDVVKLIKDSVYQQKLKSRKNISVVFVVFLTISGFASVAWIKKLEAEEQTDKSEKQKEIALNLIKTYTDTIPEKLNPIPQTQLVISEILEKNIQSLEEIYTLNFEDLKTEKAKIDNYNLVAQKYFNLLGKTDQALSFYQKAYDISNKIRQKFPNDDDVQKHFVDSSIGLANVLMKYDKDGDKTKNAILKYEESQNILERLIKKNPSDENKRSLAKVLQKIGDFYSKQGHVEKTKDYYEQSLAVRFDLATKNADNDKDQNSLSEILNELGNISLKLNKDDRLNRAFDFYNKSLEIRKKMADKHPDDWDAQRLLSVSFNYIGRCFSSVAKFEEAKQFYEESLKIRRRNVDADGENIKIKGDLAVSLSHVGYIYSKLNQHDKALSLYQESHGIREYLSSKDETNIGKKVDLSIVHAQIGDTYFRMSENNLALQSHQKALKIREQISTKYPDDLNYKKSVSTTFRKLGDVYFRTGDFTNALKSYNESLKIRQDLFEQKKSTNNFLVKQDIAIIFDNLGDVYFKLKQNSDALMYYQRSVALFKELVEQEATNSLVVLVHHHFMNSLNGLHNVYFLLNQKNKVAEMKSELAKYEKIMNDAEQHIKSVVDDE